MLRFFILIAAVFCAVSGAEIPSSNKLKYIGNFTSLKAPKNGRETTAQTGYYFFSQNAAGWATANNDCKDSLGETASLVSIETSEELEKLQIQMNENDDIGSTYWTSGKYSNGKFVWETGSEINPSFWDTGYPNSETPQTRVYAYRAGALKLRTDFQTVSLRYICELIV